MGRDSTTLPANVFLVWLTEGKYGDALPKVVRASLPGAKAWCNEHRKLSGADSIEWAGPQGTARVPRPAKLEPHEFGYFIESLPFGA